MACWCETNDKEKTKSIADAEARTADLTASIEALDQATALRQKQLAEFNAEEKDMLGAISALKSAVTVLSKHNSASMLQLPHTHLLSMAATVQYQMQTHASLLQGVFTHSQKKAVEAF